MEYLNYRALKLNKFNFEFLSIFRIVQFVGADSLEYLSVEGLQRAVRLKMQVSRPDQIGHCTACLTGEYPGGLPEELSW